MGKVIYHRDIQKSRGLNWFERKYEDIFESGNVFHDKAAKQMFWLLQAILILVGVSSFSVLVLVSILLIIIYVDVGASWEAKIFLHFNIESTLTKSNNVEEKK